MITIATDLDRTLFPNGKQHYDNTMPKFKEIVEKYSVNLIYVTGRNRGQMLEGIGTYGPPLPRYAVGEVGTKVFTFSDGDFHIDTGYRDWIRDRTENWDRNRIEKELLDIGELRLQEDHNQNEFKISFYFDDPALADDLKRRGEARVQAITGDAALTVSIDETKDLGLIDVMPLRANKMEGIDYLLRTLNIPSEEVVYCGDSGNDLVPLTAGYMAVLVGNATETVREQVKELAKVNQVGDKIYFASGNYVSGIIEGLEHFELIRS